MNDFNFLNLIFLTIVLFLTQPTFAKDSKVPANETLVQTHQNHKTHSEKHEHGKEKHDHSQQPATVQKLDNQKLLVKVKGMVCAFCAQGIRKNFNAREEVAETDVNLDTMEVSITLKKGKTLSEATIKELVTEAGFAFAGVTGE